MVFLEPSATKLTMVKELIMQHASQSKCIIHIIGRRCVGGPVQSPLQAQAGQLVRPGPVPRSGHQEQVGPHVEGQGQGSVLYQEKIREKW